MSSESTIALVVTFSILDVLAVLSNLAVLVLLFYRPSLRTFSNLLVAGLTFVELLVSTMVIPFSIAAYKKSAWTFGEGFCLFQGFFYNALYIASATLTSVISVDRYYSLASPMSHTANISETHLLWIMVSVLVHSVFWASFPFFNIGELKFLYLPSQSRCGFEWLYSGAIGTYYFFVIAVSFAVPALAIIIMYHKSVRAAMVSARKIRPGNIKIETLTDGQFTSVAKSESTGSCKAILIVSIIIGNFLVSRTPITVCNLGSWFTGSRFCQDSTELCFSWMQYLGPLTNPFVYTMLNRRLRAEITRTIKALARRENDTEEEEPKDILDYLRTFTDNYVSPPATSVPNESQTSNCATSHDVAVESHATENAIEVETLPSSLEKDSEVEMRSVENEASAEIVAAVVRQ